MAEILNQSFAKVPNTFLEGDVFRCGKCSEVISEQEKEGHVCVDPVVIDKELERKQNTRHLQSLYESLGQVLSIPVARDAMIAEIDRFERGLRASSSIRIQSAYPAEQLTRLAKVVIEKRLKSLEKIRSRELLKYQTMLQTGVSFSERRKLFGDRIALFQQEKLRLEALRQKTFLPWKVYEFRGAESFIVNLGIENFLNCFFEEFLLDDAKKTAN